MHHADEIGVLGRSRQPVKGFYIFEEATCSIIVDGTYFIFVLPAFYNTFLMNALFIAQNLSTQYSGCTVLHLCK